LKEGLTDTLVAVEALLSQITQRLHLRGEKFTVVNAAIQHEIDAFFDKERAIEPQLLQTDHKRTANKRGGLD
jgi:hypothetical protein